jgi:hypothetical protein
VRRDYQTAALVAVARLKLLPALTLKRLGYCWRTYFNAKADLRRGIFYALYVRRDCIRGEISGSSGFANSIGWFSETGEGVTGIVDGVSGGGSSITTLSSTILIRHCTLSIAPEAAQLNARCWPRYQRGRCCARHMGRCDQAPRRCLPSGPPSCRCTRGL